MSSPASPGPAEGVLRRTDGPDLAFQDLGGAGHPVLLMHGAGRSLADLLPIGALLAEDHRVVAVDFRSHGRSSDGPWTWSEVLGDVRALLDHLGWRRPALVGHSLGGMVAAMLARTDVCAAAVNLDGHGSGAPEQYDGWDPADVRCRRDELTRRSEQLLAQVLRPIPASELEVLQQGQRQMYAGLGVPPAAVEAILDRSHDVHDGTARPRPDATTMQDVQSRIDELDLLALYGSCRAPLLVVNAVSIAADEAAAADLPWLPEFHAAFRRGLGRDLRHLAESTATLDYEELDADHGLVLNATVQTAELVRGFLSKQAAW